MAALVAALVTIYAAYAAYVTYRNENEDNLCATAHGSLAYIGSNHYV